MIGQTRCHRRRRGATCDFGECSVVGCQIVNRAEEIHTQMQGFLTTSQRPRTARQTSQTLAKSRIQALNKSRVDAATALRSAHECRYHEVAAFNKVTVDGKSRFVNAG